jgi:spore maturation protein CgeB
MKLVVFGLTVSSSWGNGHATIWRGLMRALGARGHDVVFFERDVPYYAAHRDLFAIDPHRLALYDTWTSVARTAERELSDADVGIVTSYCPDARAAATLVLASRAGVRAFYDLDTPVTLSRLAAGESVGYVPPDGLAGFDLVLSYTGGAALAALRDRLGGRFVLPLYGSVDPDIHQPADPRPAFVSDLSYLGTYAADRQAMLTELLLEPARLRPQQRFLIGGSLYPASFSWTPNLFYMEHVAPSDHPAFYSSSRFTLNVTRAAMAAMGWCPSGRLFEAAACGVPIVSDSWTGLEAFFEPGREILVARNRYDVIDALGLDADYRARMARAAQDRALSAHTAMHRARDLEAAVARAYSEAGAVATPAPLAG